MQRKEKDLFKMNRSFSFVYDGVLRLGTWKRHNEIEKAIDFPLAESCDCLRSI